MTAQPSSQAEREDVAWRMLCERLQRDPATSEESDTCSLRSAWKAMLAFSDREHAPEIALTHPEVYDLANATPRSMPEEVVEAYERAGNLLPMADAPRGEYILARYRRNDDERTAHWSGRWFVIRHEGRTPSDYDLGWALFPGYGGVPDISFDGWLPLPQAGTIPGASA